MRAGDRDAGSEGAAGGGDAQCFAYSDANESAIGAGDADDSSSPYRDTRADVNQSVVSASDKPLDKDNSMDQNPAAPLTDKELDDIHWRATRGCHNGEAFLGGSAYAHEVIDQDVPHLVCEVRRLRDLIETYASTQMPFETFLTVALGEELAERLLKTNAEQHVLLEQANNRP